MAQSSETLKVQSALDLSRKGDVRGALDLLQDCQGEEALGMRFHFAMFLEDHVQAQKICESALVHSVQALSQSTWHLRRARALLFEAGDEGGSSLFDVQKRARADLIKVIGLRALDEHVQQAQRSLLSMANLS